MIPPAAASQNAEARVSPRRLAGYSAIALAVVGALLLASPLHLAGAILFVAGVALFCYAQPVMGLWLVLILSAIHPILARILMVNAGVTGTSLVVFSAWKEVGLAAVVLADFEVIARQYLDGRRWPIRLGPMDVMAGGLVALVLFGLALRHDLMAVNGARLLLFPVGVYFALRFAPVQTARYFKVMVAVAAAIAGFAVIQSSLLGWSFITTYWGIPTDPLPVTFMAQDIDGPRASATFSSPNELGFALVAWALMSCALLIVRPRRDRWLIPALAVILVGLALTFSRSAMGALALGLVLIVVAAVRLTPSPRRAFAVLALGIVPAVLVSGVIYAARGGVDMISATADTFLYGASSATKVVSIDVHSWVVGEPQAVTVTIKNIHGVTQESYRGTIHFATSDPNASLPADYTFTSDDAGTHTFPVTANPPLGIVSVGRQWIRVTDTYDANITSEIFGTFVYPPSTSLKVEVGSWTAGTESPVTVTAVDAMGNRWAGYRGTIHFTSSDPGAGLPADYTFSAADAGSHTFPPNVLPPLIFDSGGSQWVRATDKVDPSVTGLDSGIVSLPESFAVDIGSGALGAPQPVTITIKDFKGRVDPTYRGTIHFESSDPNATLPADYTFTTADAGSHTFAAGSASPLEVVSVGPQWVRVSDTRDPDITGQALETFTYPPSLTLQVAVSSWAAGRPAAVTVSVLDAQGVPWTAYRGTVHFESSDPKATLPGDYTFAPADAGRHTFAADSPQALILRSDGAQWVRAVDKIEPSLTGESSGTVGTSVVPVPPASSPTPLPSRPAATAAPPQPSPSAAPATAATASTAAPATPSPTPSAAPTPSASGPVVVQGYIPAADSSTAAHITSLTYGWDLMTTHPLGTGLGTVGPRPLPGTTDFPAYVIESYYLAMGVSLGWLGFVWAIALPLTMLFLAIRTTRRGRILEGSCLLAIALATAVVGFVLPTMMEPQMAMIPWSVCALATSSLTGEGSPKAPAPKRATP